MVEESIMGIVEDIEKEIKEVNKKVSDKKGVLDVLTEKVVSRKLLVWIAATAFLGFGKLTPDEWVAVSLAYIGIQGIADIAAKWKMAGNKG